MTTRLVMLLPLASHCLPCASWDHLPNTYDTHVLVSGLAGRGPNPGQQLFVDQLRGPHCTGCCGADRGELEPSHVQTRLPGVRKPPTPALFQAMGPG